MDFRYSSRDGAGALRSGIVTADSVSSAAKALRAQSLHPVRIEAAQKSGIHADFKIPGITDRVKVGDIAVGTRQLQAMIAAGLPLTHAVGVLAAQTENKVLAAAWVQVNADITSGSALATALSKHPKIFSGFYVALIRAGEEGGILDEVLTQLASSLEASVALRQKVKSAMSYPVVVAGLVGIVLSVILIFVVPTFEALYADLGGTLPLPTRVLLFASDVLRSYLWLVVIAIVAIGFAAKRYIATPAGRRVADRAKLRAPVFGPLFAKVSLARFSRTLGVLLRAGVPVLTALEITRDTVGNVIVGEGIDDAAEAVRGGGRLSDRLSQHAVFPAMCVQMLAVGEETGSVDDMLTKVAQFYEQEVDATVSSLTSLIEPLLVAVLGGVVGTILVSLYLPMFKLVEIIQ